MDQAGGARQHSVLGKTFHWGFIILYAYGIFKQKTAYEILSGLVGSEMCIRDSRSAACWFLWRSLDPVPVEY